MGVNLVEAYSVFFFLGRITFTGEGERVQKKVAVEEERARSELLPRTEREAIKTHLKVLWGRQEGGREAGGRESVQSLDAACDTRPIQ